MVIILSVLAVGLSRKTAVDVSLTRFFLGRLRAEAIARGGLAYAVSLTRQDSKHERYALVDTLYACAVAVEDRTPQEIFDHVPLGQGAFGIRYEVTSGDEKESVIRYGFQDESAKINLNALNVRNYAVFKELMVVLGVDDPVAETLAASVSDWIDQDSAVTRSPFGAEDDFYMEKEPAYHVKNRPLDSLGELFLVRGMTDDIFETIRNYVTVYPRWQNEISVNVNTAPLPVLRALARWRAAGNPTLTESDAETLAEKIDAYRKGEDGEAFSADDRAVDFNQLDMNSNERSLYLSLSRHFRATADQVRINVSGEDESTRVRATIRAVIDRSGGQPLYWNAD